MGERRGAAGAIRQDGGVPSPTTTPVIAPARPDVDERLDERPVLDDGSGDHDRFAHIVAKKHLTRAMVEGLAVTALCGKKWVPARDPERYPLCQTCAEIFAAIKAGSG